MGPAHPQLSFANVAQGLVYTEVPYVFEVTNTTTQDSATSVAASNAQVSTAAGGMACRMLM